MVTPGVADASVIPTALARNPSATISALAERTAFQLLHGRDLQDHDDVAKLALLG